MSVAAFQAIVALVVVAETSLRFVGWVGGVVSGQEVATITVVLGEELPDGSNASTRACSWCRR